MFLSKETISAYLIVPLVCSNILVSGACKPAASFRILELADNNNDYQSDITIFHPDGNYSQGSHYSKIDTTQKSSFRIQGTEWELVIDGKGGLSVLSRYDGCNVGGIGCELKNVKYQSNDVNNSKGVSIFRVSQWDCQP